VCAKGTADLLFDEGHFFLPRVQPLPTGVAVPYGTATKLAALHQPLLGPIDPLADNPEI
jgi:hypothetical protein